MKIGLFGILGAAALVSAANADFVGFQAELINLGSGRTAMNVFAVFTNSGDRVINIYDTAISTNTAGGFYQAAANPWWKPGSTQNYLTADDSYVTIGTNPNGNGNAGGSITAGDPSFVNFDDANESSNFSVIEGSGTGAGWYNNNPGNTWGFANMIAGNKVLVAHFVAASPTSALTLQSFLTWNVKMTYTKNGQTGGFTGTANQQFAWIIPGPGALALLGVAGLSSRRRRA
jgi:hypothetical protein